ncbi:unnamed protein product [Diatraea saccharalis]|uniref:Uncharacterized protein n=1 Tax=Diatraea saccharalis TaxID=40085 RepID=A0A9N9WJ59_9NEOP|nr:unnamed protein product [Diatraea saccharalis]
MKLNLFKRSMIFATFFGACLCIALIVASLGTTHWIDARAHRTSIRDSDGRISFGLFEGYKQLNPRYGWRSHNFSVKAGTHPARRWAWCGTAGQLGAALVSAGGACVLAVLGAAARHRCSPKPLLIANSLAVLFTLGAISVWLTEYFLRLQYNVLSDEDLASTWTSDGMADLGLSFWLVVAASISALVNIICIAVAAAEGRDADTIAPALEEKVNGAIMLY